MCKEYHIGIVFVKYNRGGRTDGLFRAVITVAVDSNRGGQANGPFRVVLSVAVAPTDLAGQL